MLDRLGTRLGSDRSGRRCREPFGLNAGQRMAQTIAARDERGEADTEELRKAVAHYRVLFDEMLEVREAKHAAVHA